MSALRALHFAGGTGRRFALLHEPEGPPSRLVVHVHAFAEEMNKSRHMVAAQARALASDGALVLLPDLMGCGDSDGELREAGWEAWVDDVASACARAERAILEARRSVGPVERWLWGHRAGALLAAETAQRLRDGWNLLLWQPVLQGQLALQQFLRADAAAAILAKDRPANKGGAKALLAAGQMAEVAGYELAPKLTSGFARSHLQPPHHAMRLEWLEVSLQGSSAVFPATVAGLQAWRSAGWTVRHHIVPGPAFWQATELEQAPHLLEATRAAVMGHALPGDHAGVPLTEANA